MTTSGKKASLWRKIQECESRVAEKMKTGPDLEVRRQRSEACGKLVELKTIMGDGDEQASDLEIEQHMLTHVPPKPQWCPWCSLAAQDDPVYMAMLERNKGSHDWIAIDFLFSKKVNLDDPKFEGILQGTFATCIVCVDCDSGVIKTIPLPSKSLCDYGVASLRDFVRGLQPGERGIRFGEDEFIKMYAVKIAIVLPDIFKHAVTSRYSAPSNPAAGAIQSTEQLALVMKYDFQSRYGVTISADDVVWPWLLRHAGWIRSRFHVKTNGRTPYRDA